MNTFSQVGRFEDSFTPSIPVSIPPVNYTERHKEIFFSKLSREQQAEFNNLRGVYEAVSRDNDLFFKTLKITRKLSSIDEAKRISQRYLPYL